MATRAGTTENTSYPQPTYLSSRHYALHVQTTAYACFDFRDPSLHEIEVWEVPARVELFAANRFAELVTQLSTRFGRPPRLPDWVFSGCDPGAEGWAEQLYADGGDDRGRRCGHRALV